MDTGMETRVGPLGAIKGIFKGIINPVEYVDSTVRSGWGTTLLIMFIVSLLVPFLTFFFLLTHCSGETGWVQSWSRSFRSLNFPKRDLRVVLSLRKLMIRILYKYRYRDRST